MNELQRLRTAIFEATDAIKRARVSTSNMDDGARFVDDPAYAGNIRAADDNLAIILNTLETMDNDIANW